MAQTYKFGNGTWATKEGSTLAYNDQNEKYKPLPFSFERDSIATRVNKEGLIEIVGNDIPRIDYTDSAEGALLLENSATNLVTHSEDFNNSYWTKNGSSVTSGFTSPSGDTSAFKLVEDTSNGQHYIEVSSLSILNTTKHTLSFYVKYNGVQFIRIFSSALNSFTYFDVLNGSIGSTTAESNNIELLSNGWYRCEMTDESISTSTNFKISLAESDGVVVYIGDGTNGVQIFGAMLEANSFSTSYIPTNGSTVQRAAETCNESGNSEVFNSQEGILYVRMNAFDNISRISLSDGSTSNRVSFKIIDDNIDFQYRVGGNYSYRVNVDVNNYLTNKILISYNNGLFVGYLNGFAISDKISGTSLGDGVINRLNLNDGDVSDGFKGRIKEIGYYNEIFTDLELEKLTSYRSLNEMVTELNLNAL